MDETKRNRALSGLCLSLSAAMLILANPIWGLTDILPDALAWGLAFLVLRRMAEIDGNLYTARKQTLYLLAVSLLKLLLSATVQNFANGTDLLLAVTVFGIVESVCMWLFFRSFLSGAETLSRNGNGEVMYGKIESMRFACSFFLIARAVCTLLPELTALAGWLVDYGEITDDALFRPLQELADGRELFLTACSGLELIAAGVWLFQFLPFLRQFRADQSLCVYLKEHLYADTPARTRSRALSSFRSARICFAFGMLCLLDMQVDGIRILPLFGFPLCFALGFWFLRRFSAHGAYRVSLCSVLIVCGVSASLLLLAEAYRHFFMVGDAMVFGEITFRSEIIGALLILICMTSLFWVWTLYAGYMEAFSSSFGCGHPYLSGLPYALFTLYALLQTAVYVLPLANRILTFVRVLSAAAFWLCANRRLAALEEQFTEAVSLQTEEES